MIKIVIVIVVVIVVVLIGIMMTRRRMRKTMRKNTDRWCFSRLRGMGVTMGWNTDWR